MMSKKAAKKSVEKKKDEPVDTFREPSPEKKDDNRPVVLLDVNKVMHHPSYHEDGAVCVRCDPDMPRK